jgi:predicted ribosomally synthesized peptide with nif11-like leader
MSVRAALQFIRQVRTDLALKDKINALGPIPDLADILPIGAEAGFKFTVEELRRAHNHDWAMRWAYYGGTDE